MSLNVLIQFNSQLTEGIVDVIVNSDLVEASEFVAETKPTTYFALSLYILTFVFLYLQAGKLKNNLSTPTFRTRVITLFLILLPFIDMAGKGASARSFPLIAVKTVYAYSEEMASMQKLLATRDKFQFNASISGIPKKETFIFIMGETSRRDYYSLYGYPRKTNPQLEKLDNLAIFKDVIAPANATVLSLMAILHLSTAEDDSLFYKTKSIVSLAKEAGYKTWWLSAQSRYGQHETTVASSGIDSDVKQYLQGGRTLSRTYDTGLLPFFEEGLQDKKEKKFIVMHLYGSHISYKKRYPEDFSIFNDTPPNYENHSELIQEKVNEYANSIAYTDFMVSEVIQKVAAKNHAACVIYTADHGEYLADNLDDDFMGHGRPEPYKVEVEVPLIVWCSPEYRQQNPQKWQEILSQQKAPISLEDMFYALSDIMHIDYALMKPERSFFNEKFIPNLPRKTRSSSSKVLYDYNQLK